MEPYCLLRRTPITPLYDDNFINYGYNKVQFIDELQYKGMWRNNMGNAIRCWEIFPIFKIDDVDDL